jgi:hypothetical protein
MLGENRATELATSLLHIGGLSGAGTHLAMNDPYGAIVISVVAALCVVLLTATVILCEMARVQMHRYLRKQEVVPASRPDQDEHDA